MSVGWAKMWKHEEKGEEKFFRDLDFLATLDFWEPLYGLEISLYIWSSETLLVSTKKALG